MRNIKKFLNNVYDDIFERFSSMKLFTPLKADKHFSNSGLSSAFFNLGAIGLGVAGIIFHIVYIIHFFGISPKIIQKLFSILCSKYMALRITIMALHIIYFFCISFEIVIRLTIHTFKYLRKFFESLKYWIPKPEFFTIGGYYHCIGLSEKLIYLLSYVISIIALPIIYSGCVITLFLSLALGVLLLASAVYIFYYLSAKGIYRALKYIYRLFL